LRKCPLNYNLSAKSPQNYDDTTFGYIMKNMLLKIGLLCFFVMWHLLAESTELRSSSMEPKKFTREGTIEIPETQYQFQYDFKIWEQIEYEVRNSGTYHFSASSLNLSGGLECLPPGDTASDILKIMRVDFDRMEEIKPISGFQTFRLIRSKDKKEQWLCRIVEDKFTLYVFVEGANTDLSSQSIIVKRFLSGIKKTK
jgi:hypothetical protein